jgi:hypothetical protein
MTDYNRLKVTELKELLKERGIPSTGLSRKNQIIEALEANDTSNGAAAEGDDVAQDDIVAENVEDATQDDQDAAAIAPSDEATLPAEEQNSEPSPQDEDVPTQDTTVPETTGSAPQPSLTVIEKNEPVSKEPSAINTPQRASPAAESVSSDTRKRKRRSPTPPLSQESVNKKLKSAEEELVKLPEDQVVDDAPAPVQEAQEAIAVESEAKTVTPSSVRDDAMEVTSTLPTDVEPRRNGSPMDTAPPGGDARDTQSSFPELASAESAGPPSTHPSTRALYIRGFVRPLQPQQLREHLVDVVTSPPSDTVIKTFHLDTLRTHAFVVFDTLAAASTARSALHGRIWPDEPARKELWVDFVPEARVQGWIEEEVGSGSRRDAKKWEVVYDTDEDGRVHAMHQEVTALPPAPGIPRQPSFSTAPPAQAPGPGQGMPNAPLGPRADRPSTSAQRPAPPERAPSQPKPSRAPSNATFDVLDQNFNHTATKPKLYWLPVEKDLGDRRLDEIASQTSRSWDGGRAMRDATAIETQLRRYTFEDGDKLVDNGADIPSFRSEGGRPPGAGRGGRGGGGFRGRR